MRARAVVVWTLCAATAARGQEVRPSEGQKGPVDESLLELEDVLGGAASTAAKVSASLNSTPSLVEIVTRAEIEQRGYRHLADVLNNLPDNHVDAVNWGVGEPVSQNVGFGFRFDTGQNVLLLFNGQRLNAFLPGNRFGIEEYLLDDVERIEVVRGPGSAIYGANAFTAVVNVITRSASGGSERPYVRGQLGALGTSLGGNAQASWGVPVGGGYVSGAVRVAADRGQPILVENTLYGNARVRDALKHAVDAELLYTVGDFRLYAKADDQRRATVTGFNSVTPDALRQPSLYGHAYSLGADYTLRLGTWGELKSAVGIHFDNWTEVFLVPMLAPDPSGTGSVLQPVDVLRDGALVTTPFVIDGQGGETMTVDVGTQLTWRYVKDNPLVVGIDVSHDRILASSRPSELQLSPPAVVPFRRFTDRSNNWLLDPTASRTTVGLYTQIAYQLASRFSFVAGARLDVYAGSGALNQTYLAFNPRVGVVFRDLTVGTFKLLFGRATRVPNGFETLSSVAILGSPSNRPEQIGTLQFAWEKGWTSAFRTQLGAFGGIVYNHLQTDANISDELRAQGFVGQFVNLPRGRHLTSVGIDGKASLDIGRAVVALNFTQLVYTEDPLNKPIGYVPRTLINGNVNVPIGDFNLNVNANFRGFFTRTEGDPRAVVAPYVLLNATAAYHFRRLPFDVRLGGRNLLNAAIRAPSSSLDFPTHFHTRGIEIWADVRYTQSF